MVAIHPGAGSAIREWGDDRFAEVARAVIDRFGAKVLWFVDPGKPRPVPPGLEVIPLSLPLGQLAAVLSRCRLLICNDSGPMHVAAALKVPVVAVFGPQRPEWFGPYGEGHRVVIRHDIWCRPCGDDCRWKEPHCLRLIPVEQVINAAKQTLNEMTPVCRSVEAGK
jgi:heptosyltransferase-2